MDQTSKECFQPQSGASNLYLIKCLMRAYCAIFLIKLNSISHTVFGPFLSLPSYFLYINLSAHQQEAVPNVAQHNEI